MFLDGRTLLFSTAVSLIILAVIIVSIRRSLADMKAGLGWFACSNICLTIGCILLSLRGVAPDWLSLLIGNTLLVAAAAQYLVAFQEFDGKRLTRWVLVAAPALMFVYLATFMYAVDSQPLRAVGIMTLLGLLFGASAFTLLNHPTRSFSRLVIVVSFLCVALACTVRLVGLVTGPSAQAALFGSSSAGTGVFVAACVVSQTSAVGFILLINEKLRARLSHLATHDALTGLLSRGAFLALAGREVLRAQRKGELFSVILADIDHFKHINDTFGHQAGDQALEAFASLTERALRRSDVIARYGGEEFIGLLPEAGPDNALTVAERLRQTIAARPVASDKGDIGMTCSIGIADSATFGFDLQRLIAAADRAMYAAKAAGRNRVCRAHAEASALADDAVPTTATAPVTAHARDDPAPAPAPAHPQPVAALLDS